MSTFFADFGDMFLDPNNEDFAIPNNEDFVIRADPHSEDSLSFLAGL